MWSPWKHREALLHPCEETTDACFRIMTGCGTYRKDNHVCYETCNLITLSRIKSKDNCDPAIYSRRWRCLRSQAMTLNSKNESSLSPCQAIICSLAAYCATLSLSSHYIFLLIHPTLPFLLLLPLLCDLYSIFLLRVCSRNYKELLEIKAWSILPFLQKPFLWRLCFTCIKKHLGEELQK